MEENKMENTSAKQREETEIDLVALARDFFRIFKRMWWLFLILVAAAAGIYGGYSYATYTPMYRCSATFTVSTGDDLTGSYSFYYDQNSADQLSKTFPYVLDSSYFKMRSSGKSGRDVSEWHLTAETVEI